MNILKRAWQWLITKKETKMSKVTLALSVLAGVIADGLAANTLTVTATDDTGAVLAGQVVTLTADTGVNLSAASLTTDASGQGTVSLTSSVAGTYNVTAILADGTTQSISVPFLTVPVADSGTGVSGSGSVVVDSDDTSVIDVFTARLKKLVAAAGPSAHHVFDELVELALKIEHPGSLLK